MMPRCRRAWPRLFYLGWHEQRTLPFDKPRNTKVGTWILLIGKLAIAMI
jgi:hypothetical protein